MERGAESGKMGSMEAKQLLEMAEIDWEEWEKTPPTVKRAVVRLAQELEEIKKKLAETEVEKQGLLSMCQSQSS